MRETCFSEIVAVASSAAWLVFSYRSEEQGFDSAALKVDFDCNHNPYGRNVAFFWRSDVTNCQHFQLVWLYVTLDSPWRLSSSCGVNIVILLLTP